MGHYHGSIGRCKGGARRRLHFPEVYSRLESAWALAPRSGRAACSPPIGQAYLDQSDRGREVRTTLKKQVSGQQGRSRINHNWGPITKRSAVIITAAEWRAGGDPFDATGRPNLGAANVYVTNIGPHDPEGGTGGVEFHLHVDWDSPLHVQVTITVLDEIEHFQVVG
jgi:hypothetical protein